MDLELKIDVPENCYFNLTDKYIIDFTWHAQYIYNVLDAGS